MSRIAFPNPREHQFAEWVLFGDYYYNASDIIHFGGEISVENLENAYRGGIFPWHIPGLPLPWFCPSARAILDFDDLHVPRSLAKERRRQEYRFTIDEDFESVIRACAATPRSDGHGTWITAAFIRGFIEFHRAGRAHSVEVWDRDGELVGGLYGVDAGGVFCGESMFFRRPNASKLALLHLVDHLGERGANWIDIQVMTPHFEALGAKEIPRRQFLDRLAQAQERGLKLF